MPIRYKLEHVIDRLAGAGAAERRRLRSLAGVKLTPADALAAWPRVLDHKWYMSERMGRDVGMRVAAVDFFENVEPLRARVRVRSGWEGLPPRLPMMLPFGERR